MAKDNRHDQYDRQHHFPLEKATVDFLREVDLECCFSEYHHGEQHHYVANGRCVFEVIKACPDEICCHEVCGKPEVEVIDFARFVNHIFHTIDHKYTDAINNIITNVNGLGGLTGTTIALHAGSTLYQDASLSSISSVTHLRAAPDYIPADNISNNEITVNADIFKALLGLNGIAVH